MSVPPDLPPRERAASYRQYAEQAGAYAERATSEEIRGSYLKLARGWHELAGKVEKESRQSFIVPLSDRALASLLR